MIDWGIVASNMETKSNDGAGYITKPLKHFKAIMNIIVAASIFIYQSSALNPQVYWPLLEPLTQPLTHETSSFAILP